MTSPAIKLARECGFTIAEAIYPYEVKPVASTRQLETFYRLAQAQALRDAADLVHDDYGCDVDSAATLRRIADKLEERI